jgi:hypothetical protein
MTTTDPEPYQPRDGEAGHVTMILAEFGRERPALLVLLQTDNVPAWFISGAMPYQRIAVEDIQIGWVEIGPDTLRPVRATS